MVTWMLSGRHEGGRTGACFIPELIKKKRKEKRKSSQYCFDVVMKTGRKWAKNERKKSEHVIFC